uniref:Uncharacterized protein n=1 Tax=Anguilla anguilla TaxID=7936 RepID=A0A0E9S2G6_ANGAN
MRTHTHADTHSKRWHGLETPLLHFSHYLRNSVLMTDHLISPYVIYVA